MAGIATSTAAQIEDCRHRLEQLRQALQTFSQGTHSPTALDDSQITAIDLLVDQTVAALALLNT